MKLATFRYSGERRVGVVDADQTAISPLFDTTGRVVTELLEVIERYDEFESRFRRGEPLIPLDRVVLEAPIPEPARNIFCVGKNYREHAREFAQSGFDTGGEGASASTPAAPIIFSKVPQTVIASGALIRYPDGVSQCVDYEAEIAVIIGRGGRRIARQDASRHIWGYTLLNDVTARDLQARHQQWLLGKSLDTFCPMGPWCVTADEVDASRFRLQCWINGELRQDALFSDLIFDVPTLIETISAALTLYPGDIIATGTPAGVGVGFKPPRFLTRGDRIRISVAEIGTLENEIR